jgi:hypothetical protein
MANFRTRFDETAAEARRLVVTNSSEIRAIISGFYGRDFDRLINSIAKLLERVDKGSVDHPEYLAHSSGNIAEYAIQLLQGVPASLESGPLHFVQTTMPALLLCEERLFKAVGHYYFHVREIKDRQVREIQKLAEESVEYREESRKSSEAIRGSEEKSGEILSSLQVLNSQAGEAALKISETKSLVDKLASGDGRGKSLEALKRTAEGKVETIDGVLGKAAAASEKAEESLKKLEEAAGRFEETKSDIDLIRAEAEAVLSLSNQAGLAGSYLRESRKLAVRSYIFTGILYATAVAAALIAAFYVLPSLEHSISANGGSLAERAIPVALLRATVLAPLVYILYFTTRQISALETLRMDYAEKAAASLAYSGYKDEMSEDISLLERLRGSLLLKFAEHPERLLRRRPVRDTIEVQTPGFRATSSSAEVSDGAEDPSRASG